MIHSISFQKQGENKSSNFLIGKINDRFLISFDVLSGIEYDLYYIIDHCDYNWEKSKLLKSEYIEGFDDVKITNYTSSFNTYQIYTNYNITFPNSNTSLKKSGNYIIRIFDEYGEELFNRKFIIYENLSSVKVDIKRSKELKNINEKQIVNFEVNPNNIRFNNPDKNVKTLVFKNSNIDSPITNVKPQYKIGNKLIYKYDKELSFWGGNEYLYFDNKNIRITNVKIKGYNLKEIYENYLFNDYPRFNKKYTYNPDINGGFLINASNSGNSNNEADYANIYFTLENYNNYLNNDQDIYIVGDFNNYSTDKVYKMQFNENKNQFEAVLKLKQGFYNYKYLIDNEIYKNDNKSVGGNFDETENVYSVLVYYRDYGERYDRIVGFGKGSSEFISN
tara:strand:- start:414 stop:1586 length:1173 start_codon:yes stop_codon:yes gene_type:complete